MTGQWSRVTLGEVITLQRGFDLPAHARKSGRVPIVSSSGITDYHSEVGVQGPGVVTGRYGTIGQVFFIKEDYWPLNTTLWVKDFQGNDPHFASYLLSTVDFRSCSDKSSVPGVNRNDLHLIPVSLPPLAEQRSIASLLGALDDKIDLNRKMNDTLDATVRTLFRSWFVDFDPVHAKAAGRTPAGMDTRIAKHFPNAFVNSELGPIPEQWKAQPLYDIATYINGAAYKAFQPNENRIGLPIVKIAELKAGVTSQTKHSDLQMPEKYRIDQGEILFSWSGNPDTSIDTFVWSHGPAWLNQHIFRVLPHHESERSFIISTLKNLQPAFAELARDKQTTGLGHVTTGDMKRLLVAYPTAGVLQAWQDIAGPLMSRALQNEVENNALTRTRDVLLPLLLSGQLRVKDAGRTT